MTKWTRREWLALVAAMGACRRPPEETTSTAPSRSRISSRTACSELQETSVDRARFPVIDFHTHVTWSAVPLGADSNNDEAFGERVDFLGDPEELLNVMDRKNVDVIVNLTGGVGDGLEATLERFDRAHPGRFLSFTEPSWNALERDDFPRFQAEQIAKAHELGAKGLKLAKTLGLYLRENVTTGPLVPVDDARFDPMWETAGGLGLPIAIHVSDPDAFFLPTDRHNERYEELSNHPAKTSLPKKRSSKRAIASSRATRKRSSSPCTSETAPRISTTSARASIATPTCTSSSERVSVSWDANHDARSVSSTSTRTVFFSAPTPFRRRSGTKRRSKFSRTSFTKSTTASSRPKTSTSTTPPRRSRPKVAGASTASASTTPS